MEILGANETTLEDTGCSDRNVPTSLLGDEVVEGFSLWCRPFVGTDGDAAANIRVKPPPLALSVSANFLNDLFSEDDVSREVIWELYGCFTEAA